MGKTEPDDWFSAENAGEAEGASLPIKCYPKALLYSVLLRWKLILGIALVGMVGVFVGLKYMVGSSMNTWTATATVFHQTRSERIPAYYKPRTTSDVARLFRTLDTARRATALLKLDETAARGLLSLVKIEPQKGTTGVIQVSVNYNNPDTAATYANAVAKAGVETYIDVQNSSINGMLREQRRQRDELNALLHESERKMATYQSLTTTQMPDEALALKRQIINDAMLRLSEMTTRLAELNARKQEIDKALTTVDKEIKYTRKENNLQSSELSSMRNELEKLKQRYTAENPKMQKLNTEIAQRQQLEDTEKSVKPGEVVYIANQVHLNLQELQMNVQFEQAAVKVGVDALTKQVEDELKLASELAAKLTDYRQLQRTAAAAQTQLERLDQSINDLVFLLNSTVPDVSIMEEAVPPMMKNSGSIRLKAAAAGFALFCLAVLGLAIWELFMGKLRSAREMTVVLGVDNLGGVRAPAKGEDEAQQYSADVLAVFSHLRQAIGSGRVVHCFGMEELAEREKLLRIWLEQFCMNGVKVFRLKVAPDESRQLFPVPASAGNDELKEQLICVEKSGSNGWFFHQSGMCLEPTEMELLKADLEVLGGAYDIVLLERALPYRDGEQLYLQLGTLAEYIVGLFQFNGIRKNCLTAMVQQFHEHGCMRIGGVLSGTCRPFNGV